MLARDQSTQMTNLGEERNESCNLLARCIQYQVYSCAKAIAERMGKVSCKDLNIG